VEILIENVGQDPVEIDVDNWDLTRYRDAHRASTLKLECSRRVPVQPYARIVATDGSATLFRGYIEKPRIKNKTARELNCVGEENLLAHRHTGRFSIGPSTRTLLHAFSSDAPNQVADAQGIVGNLGILTTANGMIPFHGSAIVADTPRYDWFDHGHDHIYQLGGLGLNSRLGAADIYSEGLLLPRVANYATLEATPISCWSDADDLWVRCDDTIYSHGFGPRKILIGLDKYDTGVRCGAIAKSETTIAGNYQGEFDTILDLLIDLAEYHTTIPFFRYMQDHTYFDTFENYPTNEFYLPEEHIKTINESVATDQRVHALICRGIGSRDVRQIYTPADHTWKGVWYQNIFDIADGHLDVAGFMRNVGDAEYERLHNDEVITVCPSDNWKQSPVPGDIINLVLDGEPRKMLQVASAKTGLKTSPEYELGARKSDIMEAFNSKSSLSRIYTEQILTKSSIPLMGSGTLITGDLTHGWCGGFTSTFTVLDSVRSADYSHRVFLDLSISADLDPEPMEVDIQINGVGNIYTQPLHYLANDSISRLDITRLVLYGSLSTLTVFAKKKGDWPAHASCASHPVMNISYTVTCYRGTSPWVNPIPPAGAGQYILRPVGQGLATEIHSPVDHATHWQRVDDEVADDSSTVIYVSCGSEPPFYLDLFTLTPVPPENEYGNVTLVTVCYRVYAPNTPYQGIYTAKPAINIDGTTYYGTAINPPTYTWSTYSFHWHTNPKTNLPWTWGNLRDMQAGIALCAHLYPGTTQIQCTQLFVIVEYA
jgi:hypothetical protein